MRAAIGAYLDDAGPGDLALLYVSGHGHRLSADSSEFQFVARDTDPNRIGDTGVAAGFVNERLEACRAPQKITIIDACESGGFAVGLRTSDAKGVRTAVLQSRGVYVLSSSGAGERSFASRADPSGAPVPSVFTGEIIDALRSGKADSDGDGRVSIEDLFHHVAARVRTRDLPSAQVPVYSSVGVTDKIIIATVMAGGAIHLSTGPDELVSDRLTRPAGPAAPPTRGDEWVRLIDYYQRCLQAESMETPLLHVDEEHDSYVYLPGRECVLSGGEDSDDRVEAPGSAAEWVNAAGQSDDELWAGYPAVLLDDPDAGPRARFAPLLMRRVEVVQNGSDQYLEPRGPVQPHPGLAVGRLGDEQGDHLVASYFATWHAGGYAQMVKDIRALLDTQFGWPTPALQPEFLADSLDLRTPTNGAQNVAVLFRVSRKDRIIRNLLKDLDDIKRQSDQIDGTALAALLPSPGALTPATAAEPPSVLATPLECNEAQQAVIASAMTARLTLATGPPGTGKSQLVTNVVANAVARNRTVLVASTNNTAVDEVWHRCQRLLPGMLIRTGNASYETEEAAGLHELQSLDPPASNVTTADAALVSATAGWQHVRAEMDEVAALESELFQTAMRREELAAALSWTTTELAARLGSDEQTARWQGRARRCAAARLFAGWRRRRLLQDLGHDGEPTAKLCGTVADAAVMQGRWTVLRRAHSEVHSDAVLKDDLVQAQNRIRDCSTTLVDAAVRTAAVKGRGLIAALRQPSSGSDWAARKAVLQAVRGWAVTSLSARQFPPRAALFDLVVVDEASQCSIPHVLPLLFRARRALIIGDPMQLPHVSKIEPRRDAEAHRGAGLPSDWLEARQLAYRRHSAFHAAERAAGGSLLLDEHFRCHPIIADLVNRLFYDKQLTVLTDTRLQRRMDRPPIIWVSATGTPVRKGGSWINDEEAEKVNQCVTFLLARLPADATIGVVTPYKAQADRLVRSWSAEPRVRAGTVHTFQGGECDAIVLGLVAGPAMPKGSVAWLEAQPNLWNVAISRARAHLVVVGDRTYWEGRGGIGSDLAGADGGTALDPFGDDPLVQRLYERLREQDGIDLELATTVEGHLADAIVRQDGTSTAVLVDRAASGQDGARHLRLHYQRTALLSDHEAGRRAVRLPAWALFDDESVLLPVN
jgi:hypothetical protein